MLTIAECRTYLDEDTNSSFSDEEIARLRDDMYALARISFSAKHKNEYEQRKQK